MMPEEDLVLTFTLDAGEIAALNSARGIVIAWLRWQT